jgi:transcriptional regulator with XRE-family HTH domain
LTVPNQRVTIKPVKRNIRQQAWREAVAKLLTAAEISQKRLADELGFQRPNVTRWLRGTVEPTPASIRAVNKAVATLLRQPQVEDCLLALALWDRRIEGEAITSDDLQSQFGLGLDSLLQELDGYFVASLEDLLRGAVKRGEISLLQFGALVVVSADVVAENLLGRLRGHVPRRSLAEELLEVVESSGFDVKPWLRPDEQIEVRRVRDRFQLAVERVLRKYAPSIAPLARQEIVVGVLAAYDAAKTSQGQPGIPSPQRSKQTRNTENHKDGSRLSASRRKGRGKTQ